MTYSWPYSCVRCALFLCFALFCSSALLSALFRSQVSSCATPQRIPRRRCFCARRRKGNATSITAEKCFSLRCCNSALPRVNTSQVRRRKGAKKTCPRRGIRVLRGAKTFCAKLRRRSMFADRANTLSAAPFVGNLVGVDERVKKAHVNTSWQAMCPHRTSVPVVFTLVGNAENINIVSQSAAFAVSRLNIASRFRRSRSWKKARATTRQVIALSILISSALYGLARALHRLAHDASHLRQLFWSLFVFMHRPEAEMKVLARCQM